MQRIELALRGGLGNQLFQVAGGIHYAKKFNSALFVDDSALRKHPDPARQNWIKKIHLNDFFFYRYKDRFSQNLFASTY